MRILFTLLALCASALADEKPAASSWAHESQLGIAMASGNADSSTYQAKQTTSYRFDENFVRLGGHYLYGTAKGVENARNWDITLRYERALSELFAIFVGAGIESDRFIGYDTRLYTDVGGKYWLIPGDRKVDYLSFELGYRFLRENRIPGATPPELTSHFVRGYVEGVKALTESVTGKAWFEALPDFAQSGNYQMNFEASLQVALHENFSLSAAYQGRYREQPVVVTNKKYDSLLLVSLVAKI